MAMKSCEKCNQICLQDMSFLEALEPDELIQISKKTISIVLRKGELLFREGEKVDGLFIIHEGEVKLSIYDSNGREQIIGIFGKGEAIWESLFLEKADYPYSAIAISEVRCCKIAKKDFEDSVSNTKIALHLVTLLSKKLHDANARNRILSTEDPSARIALLLLYRSERDKSQIVKLRLDDFAASLSLRPETVSRKVAELIKAGYLEKIGQSQFRILDYQGLREISEN